MGYHLIYADSADTPIGVEQPCHQFLDFIARIARTPLLGNRKTTLETIMTLPMKTDLQSYKDGGKRKHSQRCYESTVRFASGL